MNSYTRMKFDLHIHTMRSYDSFSKLDDIIKYAKLRGLSGIAITDHEHHLKNDDIKHLANQSIWIIKGAEIYTDVGDIIALFIHNKLASTKALDLINEIHDQNGIAILAHPFKRHKHQYPDKILYNLDAVEISNGRWKDLRKYNNYPKIDYLLSSVKGRSAGSDSHFAFEIARSYLETDFIEEIDELKKIIRSGEGIAKHTYSSEYLDGLSQTAKFLKNPSIKQLLRIGYHTAKLIFSLRKNII